MPGSSRHQYHISHIVICCTTMPDSGLPPLPDPSSARHSRHCSYLIADDVGGEWRVNLRGLQLLLLNDHDGLLILFRNVHWFTYWCDRHVHRSIMHFPIGQWHGAAGDDVCKSSGKTKITWSTRKEYNKLVLTFLTSHHAVHRVTSGQKIKTRHPLISSNTSKWLHLEHKKGIRF